MRTTHFLALISCSFLFLSCATVSKQDIAGAHFEPLPPDYQEKVKDCMKKVLVRPDTAIYRFETPRHGYDQAGLLAGGKKRFGWIAPVWIKAKNALGFYLPERKHYIFIGEGQVADCTDVFGQMTNFVE